MCTTEGLHFVEVTLNKADNKLQFRHMPSDEGDGAFNMFPFYNETVRAAVEIERNKLLVAVEGRTRLFVIDVPSRRAIKLIVNPTQQNIPMSLIPAPGYDSQTFPYLFLKDARFISLVNTKEYRIIPLIRAPNDVSMHTKHNLAAVPLSPDERDN